MGHLGIGVMIGLLSGNRETVDAFTGAIGKTIESLSLSDDTLHFGFSDGSRIKLFDDGQSCCESRYMRTDDALDYYVGATLTGGEIKEGPETADSEWGDTHEIEFMEIQTSKGVFTMSSHNEHNGYYGGFYIVARAIS